MSQKFLKNFLLLASCLAFLFGNFSCVSAKSYFYQDYQVDIFINKDSTFDVVEKQIFRLDGNFGYFYRDLKRKKLDHFSDIEILDETENPISKEALKIYWQGDEKHIQWNFPRRDFHNETKGWIIRYKVNGGLGFYKDHDELYWNVIPEDRKVEIKKLKTVIHLPEEIKKNNLFGYLYTETGNWKLYFDKGSGGFSTSKSNFVGNWYLKDNQTIIFNVENIPPYSNFTIAIGWPKGIVERPLFYREQFINWIFLILETLIILFSFGYCFLKWWKVGREPKIDKTIIARYTPPEDLPPAIVEILINQKIKKSIAATIIDLARRGYLIIEEKERTILKFLKSKEYFIKKLPKSHEDLFPFEKRILEFLFTFPFKNEISNRELRKKPSSIARQQIKKINKSIFHLAAKTGYFTGNVWKVRKQFIKPFSHLLVISAFGFFALVLVSQIFQKFFGVYWFFRIIFLFLSLIISGFIGFLFSFHIPALTQKGALQRYQWLCFKEYLGVAEKHRLASETPETFSKFLPYAIIFGVERQWIKKFAPILAKENVCPVWYVSSSRKPFSSGSASDFSNSFSSFVSSFCGSFTTNGGGVSGAGCAGGGGGGGGGGAG